MPKRERWTEADVLALTAGEPDFFDRKSGALLEDREYREKIAKALSAFANSGGGSLILGMCDDGRFDGVDPMCHGEDEHSGVARTAHPQPVELPASRLPGPQGRARFPFGHPAGQSGTGDRRGR